MLERFLDMPLRAFNEFVLSDDSIASGGGIVNISNQGWDNVVLKDSPATQLLASGNGATEAEIVNNPELLEVVLRNNRFRKLSLDTNLKLRAVRARGNPEFCEVALPSSVWHFEAHNCCFDSLDFVRAVPGLRSLSLNENHLVGHLSVAGLQDLNQIELSNSLIGGEGNRILSLDTRGCPKLVRYYVCEMPGFIIDIRDNPDVRWIDIGHNGTPPEVLDDMFIALANHGKAGGTVEFWGSTPTSKSLEARQTLLERKWFFPHDVQQS